MKVQVEGAVVSSAYDTINFIAGDDIEIAVVEDVDDKRLNITITNSAT